MYVAQSSVSVGSNRAAVFGGLRTSRSQDSLGGAAWVDRPVSVWASKTPSSITLQSPELQIGFRDRPLHAPKGFLGVGSVESLSPVATANAAAITYFQDHLECVPNVGVMRSVVTGDRISCQHIFPGNRTKRNGIHQLGSFWQEPLS